MAYKPSVACEEDVREIYLYTSGAFGVEQAVAYHVALQQTFDLIANNPEIGRARPEIDTLTRSFVCQSHTVYYQIEVDFVLILRILHGRQDPIRHL